MALVVGTNCGFCATAPSADPTVSGASTNDFKNALKGTSPGTAVKITEIGWYCSNATQETNFEVGIYTHNVGLDRPDAVVGSLSQTNAKGTTAGWKSVAVDITISSSTIYWIAVQVDATATTTNIDFEAVAGRYSRQGSRTT
ncbi:hypothetical protein LCGC14_2670340, partial [marine sediment metagenome]